MRALLLVLVATLTACSFGLPKAGTGGKNPYAGHFYCAQNDSAFGVVVVAQAAWEEGETGRGLRPDGGRLTRTLAVRQLKGTKDGKSHRDCFRWPWAFARSGRIGLVTPRDTIWGEWFDPWPE